MKNLIKKIGKRIICVSSWLILSFNANALIHEGSAVQYAGGFEPTVGFGGFGGGNCTAIKTPVIFIHGNADNAMSWDAPPTGQITPVSGRSVYDELKNQGYNDCELFGVTYLSGAEQSAPQSNYHQFSKYELITDFIVAVKEYTGHSQVNIVAHSLGVTAGMAGLKYSNMWDSVNRFINIAGALRELSSCLYVGYANPLVTTCNSQNGFYSYTFGLYP